MRVKMKLKIIIPVHTHEFTRQISASVERFRSASVSIDLEAIPAGSPFIESRLDLATNEIEVVKMAVQAESDGYDGIFVTDMDMCGVEAARQAVSIPIIGGFRPSVYTAMLLGQKVSILTVSDVVGMQSEHMRAFAITEHFASIYPLNKCVNELKNPTPESSLKILDELFELGCKAISESGADCIIFGCTGFTDLATPLSERLSEKFKQHIPVVDPNGCAIGYLIMLVENRLSHSGMTYPFQGDQISQTITRSRVGQ
jgi:Asp/Glu/hydantoin racemase